MSGRDAARSAAPPRSATGRRENAKRCALPATAKHSMTQSTADVWAQWLLHRRHGGDPQRLKATLDYLYPVHDRVLTQARLSDGCAVLDVGSGDGLIAFGALQQSPTCRVIFSDISQDLLEHAASLARQMHVVDRSEFL